MARYAKFENCLFLGLILSISQLLDGCVSMGSPPAEICFSFEDELIIKNTIETLLEMKKEGYLINNSYSYLEGIPDFVIYNRLPASFSCIAGYTNVIIDIEQNVRTCWAFRPISNLEGNSLRDILASPDFQSVRKKMYELNCSKCWSRSHTELEINQWEMQKLS